MRPESPQLGVVPGSLALPDSGGLPEPAYPPLPHWATHRRWEGCSSVATLSSQNFLMVRVASAWSALGRAGQVGVLRGWSHSGLPCLSPRAGTEEP